MFNGLIGFKKKGIRTVLDVRYYRKNGIPYSLLDQGNVWYLDPEMTVIPITLSMESTIYQEGRFEAYLSTGGGSLMYKQDGPVDAFGAGSRQGIYETHWIGQVHFGGGIRLYPFPSGAFQLGCSLSIAPSFKKEPQEEVGFGGAFIYAGFVF